ncbi:FadR/GntR family transcriptional regulator [Microbulbifer thermotolerans]|uniref:GntR family transcriptional regulator n=1 Tax=Microbulbifer thermotolerans TaxID=252514 RepID=A0A143HNV1_MICTH|nr:FCD domain-containing protein [Microbulbifer thermotolerans]AMX03414.1 GntR family transcriptional regulator [Microbulbifer thermotolerans]MCX2783053.1 GntR family transcriptional regulator [Microbulbifer thermotolerans]MCX2795415.1 GntR family transcriptional regulator [Microbulbifer thermotolerans]SFC51944.1 DNA-binding transcriptional regulator, FadR family [Microbulbifer thermotolerans]
MNRRPGGQNLTQQLVHILGAAIVNGRYRGGEGLPSEAGLCDEYGISRSATREAIKMLTAKGLVTSRPRQGIRVQPRARWNLFDPDVLGWILRASPTLEMLREFLQLRLAIEKEAAALAAAVQDKESISAVGAALARMQRAEEGLEDPVDADIAFHINILNATNNAFYIQLGSFIETALRVSIRYTNRIKGVATASYQNHKILYDAIDSGEISAARNASAAMQEEALALIEGELARRVSRGKDILV